jgi:enoyl-CoA hydratase/carnithine racemase
MSHHMSDDYAVSRAGGVVTLTITREARRNAITGDVLAGIAQCFSDAEADRSVRAIVLTGAGDKAFCAGADLQSGTAFKIDTSEPYGRLADLMRASRRVTVPVIARVNGACMAGGMGLLALADLAVAHDKAMFGLPEVKIGVFPAQVLAMLKGLVPRRALADLVLTGEPIDANEAKAIGLVNYVATDLDAKLAWLIARIVDKSPAAQRRALYTLKRIESMPFEEAAAFTESQIALSALTEDAREGQAAFRDKRKPVWTGK